MAEFAYVIGAVPALIACIQAAEVIKYGEILNADSAERPEIKGFRR